MQHSSPPASQPGLTAAEAIKSRRERVGLSRRELGRRAGLGVAYVSTLEAGQQPSLRAFARLAVELRLTSQEVFLVIQSEGRRPVDSSEV